MSRHCPPLRFCLLLGFLAFAAGCASRAQRVATLSDHPNLLSEYTSRQYGRLDAFRFADQLKEGMSRAQVRRLLGAPSFSSLFHTNRWFYITSYEEGYLFTKPQLRSQSLLSLEFDAAGTLIGFEKKELFLKDPVAFDPEKTPSYGHSYDVLTNAFRSLGRVNAP